MSAIGWLAIGTSLTAVGVGAVYAFTRASSPSVEMATKRERAPITAPAFESHGEPSFVAPTTTSLSTTNGSAAPRGSRGAQTESKARTTPAPSADAEFAEFAEDARLLRDVRAALAAGHAERALSLLEARATISASGVFAEEREAARIVTLCTLGRRAEASAAANQFLAQHGSSPLGERVRRACPSEERDGARR
jgi:RNA polymerase sigma-70 factor (ECF subfamily)